MDTATREAIIVAAVVLAISELARSNEAHGLTLDGDTLRVSSIDKALPFLRGAIKEAVHHGAHNAEGLVVHVMRSAFPERAWPPVVDSPLRATFNRMVDSIRPMVTEPAQAPGRVGLHVVE